MKAALFDVSILFALIYEQHARHRDVQAWFGKGGQTKWATCAYTQMSVMRLLGSSFAPELNLTVAQAAAFVRRVCEHPGHRYWSQDVIPSGDDSFHWERAQGRNQFPDLYLLALAVRNQGLLVTLDRRISVEAVKGAEAEHLLVL